MFKVCTTFLIVTCSIFAAADAAGDVSDPMRPPNSSRPVLSKTDKAPSWNVSAILVSEGRRLAMINDRLVAVGNTVDGARVRAIYGNAVELVIEGKAVVVRPGIRSVRRVKQE